MLRGIAGLLLLTASAALASSAPLAPRSSVDQDLRDAQREAQRATAEQLRLEQAADQAQDEVERLHARQLAAMEAIAAAEAAITASELQARVVNAQLMQQEQHLAREQAPVSALLGGLVLASRRPPLLLLADSSSADELVRLRVLLRATTPAIRARTAGLQRDLDGQAKLKQSAVAALNDLKARRAELDRRRVAFADLEQQALTVARALGSEALGAGDVAIARQEQLGDVQANASSRMESMRSANELAAFGPIPLRGAAGMPASSLNYRLPADAAVLDGLGSVSANGVRSRGIVLATRRGAPLVAPSSGTILFAGPFRDYDGVIIIDHGNGWKSVLVNAGTKLRRGVTVAIGEQLGIALGPVEIQLQHRGLAVSPALIAGSSAVLSNGSKGG